MMLNRKYLLVLLLMLSGFFGYAQKSVLDSVVESSKYDTAVYNDEAVVEEQSYADSDSMAVRENVINDSFVWKHLQDTAVLALKNSKDFEYANDSEYWKQKQIEKKHQSDSDGWFWRNPGWLSNLGVVLIIVVLLFVVYRLVVNNSLFYLGPKKLTENPLEELSEEDLNQDNINERLAKAEQEKKYSLFLRLSYIKTLFLLHDSGALHYDKQTTNTQYVFKMRQHRLFQEFRKLTYLNDYIAYGGFEINESQFIKLKEEFTDFYRKLNQ